MKPNRYRIWYRIRERRTKLERPYGEKQFVDDNDNWKTDSTCVVSRPNGYNLFSVEIRLGRGAPWQPQHFYPPNVPQRTTDVYRTQYPFCDKPNATTTSARHSHNKILLLFIDFFLTRVKTFEIKRAWGVVSVFEVFQLLFFKYYYNYKQITRTMWQ